jgi:hypothetical protein
MNKSIWLIYLWCVAGIIISIALPILKAMLPKPPTAAAAVALWETVKPFVVVGLFSALAAILIGAFAKDNLDWKSALLAGYAWDSTLQRMR